MSPRLFLFFFVGAALLLFAGVFHFQKVAEAGLPLMPMFIEGTVTVGGSAADTAIVVQGKVAEAAKAPSDGWAICTVQGSSGGFGGAASSGTCPETGKTHLKIPQDEPDTTARDGGQAGDAVQLLVGRTVNKGSGLEFVGTLPTSQDPSSIVFEAGSNPGAVTLTVANTQVLLVQSHALSDSALAVTASGTVQDKAGSNVSGATVYTDWGDNNVTSATSASNGAFSHSHTFGSAGDKSVTSAATKTNFVPGTATTSVTVSSAPGAPTADAKAKSTEVDTPVVVTLSGSDSQQCDLTFSIVSGTGPSSGSLSSITDMACAAGSPNTDTATVVYTPTADFIGTDSFGYRVNDGTVNSTEATVTITVTAASVSAGAFVIVKPATAVDLGDGLKDLAAGTKTATDTATDIELGLAAGSLDAESVALVFDTELTAGTVTIEDIAAIIDALEDIQVVIELITKLSVSAAAGVIAEIPSAKAVQTLEGVTKETAGTVLGELNTEKRTELIELMSEASLEQALPEMLVEKLFEIPRAILFAKLSKVPADHLTLLISPVPDPTLAVPTAVSVTSGLTIYQVPHTGELLWALLVGSPAPIESVLGRFAKDLANVEVRVEDVVAKPAGSGAFPSGSIVNDYFSLALVNVPAADVLQGHFTFYVEDSWVTENNINKWSVLLYRLNEETSGWARIPTHRLREGDGRIYYSAPVQGFSTFAITGSVDLPAPQFQVTSISISPTQPTEGQAVSVSATVVNLTSQEEEYNANLWLNSQTEATQLVSLPAGDSKTVSFSVIKPMGVYDVRIERLTASFSVQVGVATPTPTPPVAVPTTTPTPTSPVVVPTATPVIVAPIATPIPTPVVVAPTATPIPTPVILAPTADPTPTPPIIAPTPTPSVVEEEAGFPIIILGVIAVVFVVVATGGGFILLRRRSGG